jgi:hypothetical protein
MPLETCVGTNMPPLGHFLENILNEPIVVNYKIYMSQVKDNKSILNIPTSHI